MDWKNRVERLNEETSTSQFQEFRNAVVSAIAQELSMPFNVATGDSQNCNYESFRQHQLCMEHVISKYSQLDAKSFAEMHPWRQLSEMKGG